MADNSITTNKNIKEKPHYVLFRPLSDGPVCAYQSLDVSSFYLLNPQTNKWEEN